MSDTQEYTTETAREEASELLQLDPMGPKQITKFIEHAVKSKIVPMIHGSPAIGKSATVAAFAKKFNLKLIDVRGTQLEVTDFNGFPEVDQITGLSTYRPFDTFPLAAGPQTYDAKGNALPRKATALPLLPGEAERAAKDPKYRPKTYDGWLLFLDELPGCEPDVQKAMYKLILDREIGNYQLHPQVAIVAAGNLPTDNAMVEDMSTALASRMSHALFWPNHKDWLEWAYSANVSYLITSFIENNPSRLYTFNPSTVAGCTYAAPRTWDASNRAIKRANDDIDEVMENGILNGTIGKGVATELYAYVKIFGQLPSYSDIIANPLGASVPSSPSSQLAVLDMLAAKLETSDIKQIMQYVDRFAPEQVTFWMRSANGRNDGRITKLPEVAKWVVDNTHRLM